MYEILNYITVQDDVDLQVSWKCQTVKTFMEMVQTNRQTLFLFLPKMMGVWAWTRHNFQVSMSLRENIEHVSVWSSSVILKIIVFSLIDVPTHCIHQRDDIQTLCHRQINDRSTTINNLSNTGNPRYPHNKLQCNSKHL